MDKQQIISLIEHQLTEGKITKDDLLNLATGTTPNLQPLSTPTTANVVPPVGQTVPVKENHSKNLINIFYGIGAIIVVVGVIVLIAQNWKEIGFLSRIMVTLGISLVAYVAAFFFNKPTQRTLSQVMFTISAVLAPLGVGVYLTEFKIRFDWLVQVYTSLALGLIFGVAWVTSKKNILSLLTIGFLTWSYVTIVIKIFGFSNDDSVMFLKAAAVILGASYLLVAYGHKASFLPVDNDDAREKRSIEGILYALGTLAVLGGGITLGGAFDLAFIAVVFAGFYGSVYLKSRAMLVFSAIFLAAHIIKLTSKYFVDSIGWPVALIGVGFLIIGVGYLTFYLNRKFISAQA